MSEGLRQMIVVLFPQPALISAKSSPDRGGPGFRQPFDSHVVARYLRTAELVIVTKTCLHCYEYGAVNE
jgi:hypothetical protein